MKWLTEEDIRNKNQCYMDCLIWLLTTILNDIKIPTDKYATALETSVVNIIYHIPINFVECTNRHDVPYWGNYTWIIKTYLTENKTINYPHIKENCYHYKMKTDKEEMYPPIPEFLFNFWLKYREQ